jgi:hypothetical protein
MFVRVKKVGSRRYVYLVEGRRKGNRVRQKTLSYLGPVPKLVYGVSSDTKRRVDKILQVDWERVNERIARITLTFEELAEAKRVQYPVSIRASQPGSRTQGRRPRVKGEQSALTVLAARRFNEMFEEIGDREYRMR